MRGQARDQQLDGVQRVLAEAEALRPGLPTHSFSLGPCRFDVTSDEPRRFKTISHQVVQAASPVPCRVVYSFTALSNNRLLRRLKACFNTTPDALIETFVGETLHARFDCGPGIAVFVEAGDGADERYAVLREGSHVLVLVADPSDSTLDRYVLRALREIYLREIENLGGVMLHAAAFVSRGVATAVVGTKGAGKTSLTLAVCLDRRCEYVANDRVAILPARADELYALPFPLACRVGVGMARGISLLQRAAERGLSRVQDARLADSGTEGERGKFGSDVKLEFTTLELERLLGVPTHPGAPLRRVVVPMLAADCAEPRLVELSPSNLTEELRPQVMTPYEEKWLHPWLVERTFSELELSQTAERLVSDLTEDVPGYRLEFGFDYWRSGRLDGRIAALLELH